MISTSTLFLIIGLGGLALVLLIIGIIFAVLSRHRDYTPEESDYL